MTRFEDLTECATHDVPYPYTCLDCAMAEANGWQGRQTRRVRRKRLAVVVPLHRPAPVVTIAPASNVIPFRSRA